MSNPLNFTRVLVICAFVASLIIGLPSHAQSSDDDFPGRFGPFGSQCDPQNLGIDSLTAHFCRSQMALDFSSDHPSCGCIRNEFADQLNDSQFRELCSNVGMPYFQCNENGCAGIDDYCLRVPQDEYCTTQPLTLGEILKRAMNKCVFE